MAEDSCDRVASSLSVVGLVTWSAGAPSIASGRGVLYGVAPNIPPKALHEGRKRRNRTTAYAIALSLDSGGGTRTPDTRIMIAFGIHAHTCPYARYDRIRWTSSTYHHVPQHTNTYEYASATHSQSHSRGKITRGHERTQTDAVSACPRSHVPPHHTLAARPCLGCGPDCGPRGHEATNGSLHRGPNQS